MGGMGGRGHGARRAFLSGLCPLPTRAPWSGAGQVCGEETKFPAEATAEDGSGHRPTPLTWKEVLAL